MRYEARFVVETHAYLTTLYKPHGKKSMELEAKGLWSGLNGEVESFNNSALCLYDMDRYGVDMCILKPSVTGTTNEMQAELVDKYPDKFRAMCNDQNLKIKVWRGECEWTLEAALEEVDAALKTGKYVGIGESAPGSYVRHKKFTFRERLDEYRTFMDLAAKYDVTMDWREYSMRYGWDPYHQLSQLSREYPDVTIIILHGGGHTDEGIKKACSAAGRAENIYLECGHWPAEYFEIALKDPNVGATQLIWGGTHGTHCQYITAHPGEKYQPPSYPTLGMRKWPLTTTYQTDFWGWSLRQINKIADWNLVTQDEINLILGGNAAKIFKLPVPFERMFPEGRPDLGGIHWKKSIPFIPKEQVQNPDKF